MEKILLVIFCGIISPAVIIWCIKRQIQVSRQWKAAELKEYLKDLYKITCASCGGSGYEGYTLDGDPNGEICEHCDSFGYVWRCICPPRWLKHGCIWRHTEIEALKGKL